MDIKILKLGELETNCYLLFDDDEVLVIDPASEINKIKKEIGKRNLVGIIITHYHFDHIGALDELKETYNTKVYDYNNLDNENEISKFKFKMIKTPGHSDDSITIYFDKDKIMFVGDFVFKNTIGRTDFETGNVIKMKQSIEKLKKYDDVVIYPGHGESTTLDYEKKNNYFFQ